MYSAVYRCYAAKKRCRQREVGRVYLLVEEVERRGQVEPLGDGVLKHELRSGLRFLRGVHVCGVEHAVNVHELETAYDILGEVVVKRCRERVFLPRLDVVELQRGDVLWVQVWVTERDVRGVGHIMVGVELAASRTVDSSCVVKLYLVVSWQCVREEHRRERLEVAFLRISYAVGRIVHDDVLAAYAELIAEVLNPRAVREIRRIELLLVSVVIDEQRVLHIRRAVIVLDRRVALSVLVLHVHASLDDVRLYLLGEVALELVCRVVVVGYLVLVEVVVALLQIVVVLVVAEV